MALPSRSVRVLTALCLALAGTIVTVVASQPAHAASNTRPVTIPALQQWTGGTRSYLFGPGVRIVRDTTDATALAVTSQTFAADLKSLSGFTIAQTTGTSAAQPGDIFLSLGSTDAGLGSEGYSLSVADRITIKASTDAGVFYGTRTVLQLLHQKYEIPQGSARDWPVKAERGEMVDNGRKYYTVSWLENQIQELAYLKMNTFHWHLSDDQGFRIESDTHPEIVSADHLSKADVRTLLAFAAKYHVTVIPEIDMPGHMTAILTGEDTATPTHTPIDLRLKGKDGSINNNYLDVSNPAGHSLMKDLINEFMPLFPGPYFFIGADEYNPTGGYSNYPQLLTYARQQYGAGASAADAFLGFINAADAVVQAGGKTARIWNDSIGTGSAVSVNKDVEVNYWYNFNNAQTLANEGYQLSNESWDPTYYVLGGSKPNQQWGYETWTPDTVQGGAVLTDPSENLGSMLHIWADHPTAETEDQTAAGILDIQRILSQQLWGSPKLVTAYTDFQTVIAETGRNPAWPATPAAGVNLALGKPATASSTDAGYDAAANATDGNLGTRWSSAYSDPQWLQVDLGSAQAIGEVKIDWEAAYGKAYQIQVSDDAVNWTTIYSTTAGTGGNEDLTGLSGSGRYIRLYGTQRGTSWGYSIYEFQVYSADLAQGRLTTASSVEPGTSFTPDLATDGLATTRWASAHSDPQWLLVDLGSTRSVTGARLTWEAAFAKAYQIQVSKDAVNWTTIYSTTTGAGGVNTLTGLSGSGRYIRVNGTQRGTGYGYSLWSFQVFGS